ncbi:MAG: hypothetical protein ABI199_07425 [Bacteroidia bacterium]
MAKKVLTDHKPQKGKLIAPFNHMLGGLSEISHINKIIPEISWQAILIDSLGFVNTCALLNEFLVSLKANSEVKPLCFASNFISFNQIDFDRTKFSTILSKSEILVRLFPDWPMKKIFDYDCGPATKEDIEYFRDIVNKLLDKRSVLAVQSLTCTVHYLMLTNKFHLPAGSHIANISEIIKYPETDVSRAVASSIRSVLNIFIGNSEFSNTNSLWPANFWNTLYLHSPCTLTTLHFDEK